MRGVPGMVLATVVACALTASVAVTAGAASVGPEAGAVRHEPALAEYLRQTMDGLKFQEVLDLAPPDSAPPRALRSGVDKDSATTAQRARAYAANSATAAAAPISQQPQLTASVLELGVDGRILSSATVLMSPEYVDGVVVPVDANHHTTGVRWREWDDEGWYTNHGQGTVDVVPGRESAPLDFMLPYPASVLKLMVGFGVLRLVDRGVVGLGDTYAYQPTTVSSLCGGASSNSVSGYLDAALTWSSNAAACALIKLLWDHDAIDELNAQFQALGLETLRLAGTNPANGGRWSNSITMGSLDTAKLLALFNGGPGTLWTAPNGQPVTRAVLSDSARRLLRSALGQQGWNWMLSTTNYCGREYPAAGLPQRMAKRWIGPDGTVTVDGNAFGRDVRPCDRAAQVNFAHKPGWVNNSGADAGIVRSLPGAPFRHYIITVFSNLGDQYQDPGRPPTPDGVVPVEFTEKFALLARAIDEYEVARNRRAS